MRAITLFAIVCIIAIGIAEAARINNKSEKVSKRTSSKDSSKASSNSKSSGKKNNKDEDYTCTGEDYATARDMIAKLSLSSADLQDAFDGLDVEKDNKQIDKKDLDLLYWHGEAKFAIGKFTRWLKCDDAGNVVGKQELDKFLQRKASILAVIECTYIKSESLKEHCLADQLLTYIYLILDQQNVIDFYNEIENDDDDNDVITKSDISYLKAKYPDLDDDDIENFMEELGGGDDDEITLEEFEEYVTQEDISDDFRQCRKGINKNTGYADYDKGCLVEQLFDYVQNDLTEMDIAVVFKSLDSNGDGHIDETDLKKIDGCDALLAKKIVDLLDHTGNDAVDYGEFRTYMKSPTVRLQIERGCTEPIDEQNAEIKCISKKFITLAKELHDPIWLTVPDLDMLFTFEEIDTTNDGIISVADLKDWDDALAKKFLEEANDSDKDKYVDLEEFFEYTDVPHMVYGMADCMIKSKDESRVDCYEDELKDIIKDFLENNEIEAFFKSYDTNNDGFITEKDLGKKMSNVDYFLIELGMGDKTVSKFEFTWYVKQQELADLYKGKSHKPKHLHNNLVNYINDVMTEYDIEMAFATLDEDGDHELGPKDLPNNKEWVSLYENIDSVGKDEDKTANFVEFWLWLHMPSSTSKGNTRKETLENTCTKKHDKHDAEVDCYKLTLLSGKY